MAEKPKLESPSVEPLPSNALKKEQKHSLELSTRASEFIRYEINKSPEHERILDIINDATNRLFKQYGLKSKDQDYNSVHILSSEAPQTKPFFETGRGDIIMPDISNQSKLLFAEQLFHETMHQKTVHRHDGPYSYQVGLMEQNDSSEIYFEELNEAITAELEKIFYQNVLRTEPLFKKEAALVEEIKDKIKQGPEEDRWISDEVCATIPEKDEIHKIKQFSYPNRRRALRIIIDRLCEKQSEYFNNREEAMDIFFKAMLSGDTEKLKKIIESAFGEEAYQKLQRGLREFLDFIFEEKKTI